MKESGRSIVEVLGVIAIVGVITVLGIIGYSSVMEKKRRDAFEVQIHDISIRINEMYMGRRFAPSNSYIYFTDDLLELGFNMIDPWGNDIRARFPVFGADDSDQYALTFRLSRARCEYTVSRYDQKVHEGDVCATIWSQFTNNDICDNRGCVEEENLVVFRYRIM